METLQKTKTAWAIDIAHSELQFKVKHLMISTVTGEFKKFSGRVEAETDSFEGAEVEFEVFTDSIETGNSQRDKHLKSVDFFEVEKYPVMRFTSSSFNLTGDNRYLLKGNFELHGISKEITLEAVYGGSMVDPWGNTKAGFEIKGQINRKDYGLNWNAVTEAGGIVVAEEVKIHANIQLIKTN
jgi:polyisoprenoid-binding protein YceI